MDPTYRHEQLIAFVKNRLEAMQREHPKPDNDPAYRVEHTLRVAHYGRQIAAAEGADVETVTAACLLHDVAHFDPIDSYRDHGRAGAAAARPLLESLGYTPEQVDNICYSIAVHVDGQAGYEHAHTLEARCTSDADNVDRYGALQILMACHYTGGLAHLEQMAAGLKERLPRLEQYRVQPPLETAAGNALFVRQLDLQIAMFQALVDQWELTRL